MANNSENLKYFWGGNGNAANKFEAFYMLLLMIKVSNITHFYDDRSLSPMDAWNIGQ